MGILVLAERDGHDFSEASRDALAAGTALATQSDTWRALLVLSLIHI